MIMIQYIILFIDGIIKRKQGKGNFELIQSVNSSIVPQYNNNKIVIYMQDKNIIFVIIFSLSEPLR